MFDKEIEELFKKRDDLLDQIVKLKEQIKEMVKEYMKLFGRFVIFVIS